MKKQKHFSSTCSYVEGLHSLQKAQSSTIQQVRYTLYSKKQFLLNMLCTHSTTNHPPVHAHCCSYLPPCSRCNRDYVGCGPLQTSRESRVHYTWTFKICKNNLPSGRFLLVTRHKFYTLGRSRSFLANPKTLGKLQ